MKTILIVLTCMLLLVPAVADAQRLCPPAGALNLTTSLAGTQFGAATGAPTGFGRSFITLDPLTNRVTVRAQAAGIGDDVTAAELRRLGSLQPFLTLTDPQNTFDEFGMFERTVTVTPAEMQQLLADPAAFEFVVTTNQFPAGAVSGRLMNLQSLRGTFRGDTIVGGTGALEAGGAFHAFITPGVNDRSNLNFIFTPVGIGTDIIALDLRLGATGVNGPLVTTLAENATLVDGRLVGSVPIDAAVAQQLMTNPAAFNIVARTPQFPEGAARAQFASLVNDLFVPVAGSVPGAAGTQWETDLRIFNASHTSTATVTIAFLPAGENNVSANATIDPAAVAVVTIPARGVRMIDNVMNSLFGLDTTLGALRLSSDEPIAAMARVFNDERSLGLGTTGFAVPAMTICDATSRGIITGVAGSRTAALDTQLRTNVGLFNPNGQHVVVHFTGRGRLGTEIGSNTIILAPFGHVQLPLFGPFGVLPDASDDLVAGAIVFEASAPIFAYAAVIDNVSADSSLVLPVDDPAVIP